MARSCFVCETKFSKYCDVFECAECDVLLCDDCDDHECVVVKKPLLDYEVDADGDVIMCC